MEVLSATHRYTPQHNPRGIVKSCPKAAPEAQGALNKPKHGKVYGQTQDTKGAFQCSLFKTAHGEMAHFWNGVK